MQIARSSRAPQKKPEYAVLRSTFKSSSPSPAASKSVNPFIKKLMVFAFWTALGLAVLGPIMPLVNRDPFLTGGQFLFGLGWALLVVLVIRTIFGQMARIRKDGILTPGLVVGFPFAPGSVPRLTEIYYERDGVAYLGVTRIYSQEHPLTVGSVIEIKVDPKYPNFFGY